MTDKDFDQHRDDVATGDTEPLIGEEHLAPHVTLDQLQDGDMVKCLNNGQVTTVRIEDGTITLDPPLHDAGNLYDLKFTVVTPKAKPAEPQGPTAEEIKSQLAELFYVVGILQTSVSAHTGAVSTTAHVAEGMQRLLTQLFRLADDYHRKTGENHLVGLYGKAGI